MLRCSLRCPFQLNAQLQEMESQSAEKISELETQLMQATKEAELLKVFLFTHLENAVCCYSSYSFQSKLQWAGFTAKGGATT